MTAIQQDGQGQPYIQWAQDAGAPDGQKRAWIQRREGDSDWAGTGRYLNVVRMRDNGQLGGNATDFPIFGATLTDAQILEAFVSAVCAITGCALPD